MKVAILLGLFVVVCVFSVKGSPLAGTFDEEEQGVQEQDQPLSRVKRVTCDVGSIEIKGIKLNDSACALHCLSMRRSGGYCNGKRVCVCR